MNSTYQQEYEVKLQDLFQDVRKELIRANKDFTDQFKNAHEGYAVILEEIDELWEEVKKKQKHYDLVAMKKEAIQIAAMAFRFAIELT